MKIPIIMNSSKHTIYNNKQMVEVWHNGKKYKEYSPIEPYFYSLERFSFPYAKRVAHKLKLMSDITKTRLVYKYSFKNIRTFLDYRNEQTFEDRIPFNQRLCIDCEDWILKYPETKDLVTAFIDIEVNTENHIFPKASKYEIIGIGIAISKGNDESINNHEPEVYLSDSKKGSEECLEFLTYMIKKHDFDIYSGFNIIGFDMWKIIQQMNKYGMDTSILTRTKGRTPYLDTDFERPRAIFDGRIVYDIMKSVNKDQSLNGIADRQMKTVAKRFKLNPLEFNDIGNMYKYVGSSKLEKYLRSDVEVTRALHNVYFPRIVALAEEIVAPLNLVVDSTQQTISTILMARELKNIGIISHKENFERHPEIESYQAAIIKLVKPGFAKKVYKVDFISFYPSIIIEFNISPETTRIVDYEDKSDFKIANSGNGYIYYFCPDDRIDKNVIIEVNNNIQGVLPQKQIEIRDRRNELKKLMKQTKDKHLRQKYSSQENSLKVEGNAIYGSNGNRFFRFGDYAVSILTTAICRELITEAERLLGDTVRAVHTDGIHVDKKPNLDWLNEQIGKYIKKELKV